MSQNRDSTVFIYLFARSLFKLDLQNITCYFSTVKLGEKERFHEEQIGVKEPFPMTK